MYHALHQESGLLGLSELSASLKKQVAWLGPIAWMVIPADEEGLIARSCRRAMEETISPSATPPGSSS
jgi:acetate kinase